MAGTANQPGTPGLLRAMNDRAALALLLDHGPLTRAQIGELTGLSKPTASQVVARLEGADLISEVGSVAPTRGPSAVTYGIRGGRLHAVAVDVRPHQVVSTLVDPVGTEFPVADVGLPKAASGRSAVTDIRAAIDAACAAAGVDPQSVATAMVGLQGAVDPRTDDLAFTGLMPGWPRRNVRAELEAGLGIPVRIDNDVNLAAVAERNGGAVGPRRRLRAAVARRRARRRAAPARRAAPRRRGRGRRDRLPARLALGRAPGPGCRRPAGRRRRHRGRPGGPRARHPRPTPRRRARRAAHEPRARRGAHRAGPPRRGGRAPRTRRARAPSGRARRTDRHGRRSGSRRPGEEPHPQDHAMVPVHLREHRA